MWWTITAEHTRLLTPSKDEVQSQLETDKQGEGKSNMKVAPDTDSTDAELADDETTFQCG